MHFSWDISIGQTLIALPLAGVFFWVWRISSTLRTFMVEHEMLMSAYADGKNIRVNDLPTRSAKRNW